MIVTNKVILLLLLPTLHVSKLDVTYLLFKVLIVRRSRTAFDISSVISFVARLWWCERNILPIKILVLHTCLEMFALPKLFYLSFVVRLPQRDLTL